MIISTVKEKVVRIATSELTASGYIIVILVLLVAALTIESYERIKRKPSVEWLRQKNSSYGIE